MESVLESVGYVGIFASVFIECGFLPGLVLPLPGFSLLFTASVFAASGQMDLPTIIIIGIIAAILGYASGYFTGLKYGRKLFFEKETRKYFTRQQGEMTERFMKKYGYTTLIISRFLPIMHSLAPLLSGVAKTPLLPFMIVNVVGGVAWVLTATLLGYYMGQTIPGAQYFAIPLVIAVLWLVNTRSGHKILMRIAHKVESL